MTNEKKRLLRVRTDKGARFRRDGAGKKSQLADSWRRPRGLHHKQRIQKKARGALPTPGFGSPLAVREMHPSGFYEVRVFTPSELDGIDPASHAVRIAGSVGGRKRAAIQEMALKAGLKILNPKEVTKPVPKTDTGESDTEADEDE